MGAELDDLIALYAAMHDAPSDEYDRHFTRLKLRCDSIAEVQRCSWRDVMAFVRKKYFARIASEEKREGKI
jgi:hypothetical protein